jgi:hypothetical protein
MWRGDRVFIPLAPLAPVRSRCLLQLAKRLLKNELRNCLTASASSAAGRGARPACKSSAWAL